jgi:hypothetical protein
MPDGGPWGGCYVVLGFMASQRQWHSCSPVENAQLSLSS